MTSDEKKTASKTQVVDNPDLRDLVERIQNGKVKVYASTDDFKPKDFDFKSGENMAEVQKERFQFLSHAVAVDGNRMSYIIYPDKVRQIISSLDMGNDLTAARFAFKVSLDTIELSK